MVRLSDAVVVLLPDKVVIVVDFIKILKDSLELDSLSIKTQFLTAITS